MIEFNDNLLAIYFLKLDDQSDWLMSVSRQPGAKIWITSRFRYYSQESKDPFDDKDEKNWTIREGPEEGWLDKVRLITGLMSTRAQGPLYELIRGERSLEEFMDEFRRQPFVHTKKVSKEEYERLKR